MVALFRREQMLPLTLQRATPHLDTSISSCRELANWQFVRHYEEQIVVRQIPVVAKIIWMCSTKSRIVVIPSQEFMPGRQFWEMDAKTA